MRADESLSAVNSAELIDLKTLAENRAAFARTSLFERVAGLLFEGSSAIKPEVRTLIDDILVSLIGQVERQVRADLAQRVAALHAPPPALSRLLAQDEILVARPILLHSSVLTEPDLLAIAAEASADHRQAIAQRPQIGAKLSSALAARREPRVIETLLANTGAIIPRELFDDLVALSQSVEALRKPLLARAELPKDLAYQMFWWVSAALRRAILERFTIDTGDLDACLAAILLDAESRFARAERAKPPQWRSGEINALMAKLRSGDMNGFTQSIASLAGIAVEMAARIVSDCGGEALAVLAKAIGCDRTQVTTIFLHLDYKRHGQARPIAHIETIARIYDAVPAQRARLAVSLWNAQTLAAAA